MKRTTRLLLRSFLGPFVVTFLVALFFLDMQFLWVYADELIGKGLAVHCRGNDRYGHHHFMSRPDGDMTEEGMRQWQMANDNWNDILYAGAEKTRDF